MTSDKREEWVMSHMPKVGDSFRLFYGEDNRANKVIHVRAIVDDEYIVYRHWRHGGWIYQMTDPTFFAVSASVMTKLKSKPDA